MFEQIGRSFFHYRAWRLGGVPKLRVEGVSARCIGSWPLGLQCAFQHGLDKTRPGTWPLRCFLMTGLTWRIQGTSGQLDRGDNRGCYMAYRDDEYTSEVTGKCIQKSINPA